MAQEERRPERPMDFRLFFRALGNRNFRLFFVGQGISLIGTWMQMTAVAWLVWRLSHSALLLGLVGFAARIPTFVLAPFAGVLIDRMNRHRLVIVTQVLAMAQALMLAGLMYADRLTIPHVIALSLLLGFINALDVPARQSFLVQMLDRREDLTNAIALNSSMVNGARLIGPSIAGLLIAGTG
jgi:MFS family permease